MVRATSSLAMPYVSPEHRRVLDPAIRELASRLAEVARSLPEETAFAGLLNYACTSVAMEVVHARFGRMRYGVIATLTGVFKNIADEFYRRVASPYEDEQLAKNGDLPLFEAYSGRPAAPAASSGPAAPAASSGPAAPAASSGSGSGGSSRS
jgi:hypothetical protein